MNADQSPLKRLHELGQSPWLDYIDRHLLLSGELGRMIEQWGLTGLTSNPAIFERAIAETRDYDADIERLVRGGEKAERIYEKLAIADLRAAADAFLPAYRDSDGADGFVSLEVSPHLARDEAVTVAEARRLWRLLDRPNAMIKVPGTREGLGAIRSLLAEGINVNVTLLFAVQRYAEVFAAYLDGLEAAAKAGLKLERIASVASFFLSRIDTAVDAWLDRLPPKRHAAALRGTAAIASAGAAYRVLEEKTAEARFQRLVDRGARVQRLLWASTSTKDPRYADVKYVEPLIGPHTVNTMPLETLRAYDDHGRPEAGRIAAVRAEAGRTLSSLSALGLDMSAVTEQLLEEGIVKFERAYDTLLGTLAAKPSSAAGTRAR